MTIEQQKRKIEKVYREKGEGQARKAGHRLSISDGMLTRWFLSWDCQASDSKVPKHLQGKRRVCFRWSKHHLKHVGTVINEGSEQSEVLWDLGYSQFVCNDWIITIGDSHGNRERPDASEGHRKNKKATGACLIGK